MPYADANKQEQYFKSWREKNKDHLKEYSRQWRRDNREYRNKRDALYHRMSTRKWRRRLAKKLGNACSRCGNDDHRVFQFHHKNRDGKSHRNTIGGGSIAYYKGLIQELEDKPKSIELLCANCHAIEHWIPDSEYTPGKRNRNLKKREVREIRTRHANGESIKSIAKSLDRTRASIRRLVKRETYTHVK